MWSVVHARVAARHSDDDVGVEKQRGKKNRERAGGRLMVELHLATRQGTGATCQHERGTSEG
jgi:hypothetical protein